MAPDVKQVFLSVGDVAERLSVSPSCVYQLIESGRLAHHRIGVGRGAIRVSQEDLYDYLSACRRERKGEEPRRTPRPKLKHLRLPN